MSFEAERRGASRVLATDRYVWRNSAMSGKAGFNFACAALHSKVEDMEIGVMDLSPERVGTFDVVLFLGVLYHLRHPLLALERVRSVTKTLLIMETHVDLPQIQRPAMAFYAGSGAVVPPPVALDVDLTVRTGPIRWRLAGEITSDVPAVRDKETNQTEGEHQKGPRLGSICRGACSDIDVIVQAIGRACFLIDLEGKCVRAGVVEIPEVAAQIDDAFGVHHTADWLARAIGVSHARTNRSRIDQIAIQAHRSRVVRQHI